MKCSLLTLSCALDGELSRERQLELDAHLVTCERCKTGMRYLREETERISVLAPVRLSPDTATALLDRSRVLAPPSGAGASNEDRGGTQVAITPDPFGSAGIGAALLDPASATEIDPVPPPSNGDRQIEEPVAETAREVEAVPDDFQETAVEEPEAEAAEDGDSADEAPEAVMEAGPAPQGELGWVAADSPEPAMEGPAEPVHLERGSAFDAEEADLSDARGGADVSEEDWLADEPGPMALVEAGAPSAPADAAAGAAGAAAAAVPEGAEAPEAPGEPRPGSVVVPGWEPVTELDVPWAAVAAAGDADSTWSAEVPGIPSARHEPLPPPAPFPAASPPTRPAEAAVPSQLGDPKDTLPSVRSHSRRGSGGSARKPPAAKAGGGGPQARSWTRIGLIAVAALAAVLIIWDLTHGTTSPPVHHPKVQSTPTTAASPAAPTPTPRPSSGTPAPQLTGTQTIGGGGSGYQVQTARYGAHGSQFWVVLQLVQGSGNPQVTTGFDGAQTLYVEMQGVAPGTAVPQPAPGTVVTSVSVGQVPGFNGAVYVIHLARAVQVSPSFVPGNENGGAGNRLLLILQ